MRTSQGFGAATGVGSKNKQVEPVEENKDNVNREQEEKESE